jgi:hypothetical protein
MTKQRNYLVKSILKIIKNFKGENKLLFLTLISSNNDKENILNMSSVESEKIFHSFIDEKILNGKIFELKNILTFLNESKISNLVFKNEQEFSNEQINVCKLLYNNLEDELLDHFLKNENNRKMLNLPI